MTVSHDGRKPLQSRAIEFRTSTDHSVDPLGVHADRPARYPSSPQVTGAAGPSPNAYPLDPSVVRAAASSS
jgi:hypothetical protein